MVHDETTRAAIRNLYLDAWHDYVSHLLAGLIPFSPLAVTRIVPRHSHNVAPQKPSRDRTDLPRPSRSAGHAGGLRQSQRARRHR